MTMSRGAWYKKLAEEKGYEFALDTAIKTIEELEIYLSAHYTMEKVMGELERRRRAQREAEDFMDKAIERLRSKE